MKLKRRVAALESAGRETCVPTDMSRFQDLYARLDAWATGRLYSQLFSPPPAASTKPEDPTSPGARLEERLGALRKTLANDVAFEQQRRDTLKAIEQEWRDAERKQRQKAKRQRKAEQRRLAAAQIAA